MSIAAAAADDDDWRRILKHRRDLLSVQTWTLLLIASARHVLVTRESILAPKNRMSREVTDGITGLNEALDLRATGIVGRLWLLDWVRQFLCADSAQMACFEAALNACQIERNPVPNEAQQASAAAANSRRIKVSSRPTPRGYSLDQPQACVFSGLTDENYIITLSGNVDPAHPSNTQFHISSWIINRRWLHFIRACVVVGRIFEWMDAHVASTLGSKRTLNQQESDTLVAHGPLLELRQTFNSCCLVMFHSFY
jgi:hypothetical protein